MKLRVKTALRATAWGTGHRWTRKRAGDQVNRGVQHGGRGSDAIPGEARLGGRGFGLDVSIRGTASFATMDEAGRHRCAGQREVVFAVSRGRRLRGSEDMETDLDVCTVRTRHPLASCTKALGVGTACLDPRVSKEARGRRDRRGVQTEHVGVKGSV